LNRIGIIAAVSVVALTGLLARGEDAAPKAAAKASAGEATAKPAMPPAVSRPVEFVKDVVPIFQSSCVTCHTSGKSEADLSLETREKILEGGASEPAIVPGNSADSLIVQLVTGQDPERIMPAKGKRLTPEQVGVLRAWIDQGANWPKDYVLHDASRPVPAKLEPRNVAIPMAHDGLTNPIDLLLEPYFKQHNIMPAKTVDDRVFARRVYLDLIGLLPPSDDVEKFVADTSPDKRAALVHRLLDDKQAYAVHWLSFWNDLLRNDYKGTGYIDGGRLPITPWLYHALLDNAPYDQFVRELVTGRNGSEGFTKGIVWRGVVNAAQTPPMQAAQNIGQVFMGVNLKCASCHDSFVSQWKLTDSYGLAGVYADKAPEMERCTKPLGKTADMKFLYPQLGTIDANQPREKRLEQLAQAITSERNGRLSRTIVNRIWQRLMGRGLIEPVDEMDNKPWNADLLDALAWRFSHNNYDMKKTIEMIVLSRAYQLPAVAMQEGAKEFVFAGPGFKRMAAEQFVDAVSTLTGIWPAKQDAMLSSSSERFAKTKWIWSDKNAATAAAPGTIYLRKVMDVKPGFATSSALISCDNQFKLFVNGKQIATGDNWQTPVTVDLKPHLVAGKNVLAVIAVNTLDAPNPAGFWFNAVTTYDKPIDGRLRFFLTSDVSWKWSKEAPDGWNAVAFDDEKWAKAAVLGDTSAAPWALAEKLPGDDPSDHPPEIRAALCAGDPLTSALGRPNREQVATERPKAATTLLALELTNGTTLTEILERGAKKMSVEPDLRAEVLINRVYEAALSRPPSKAELSTAKEVVGVELKEDGVEDFLWAVVMLPEFQLIR
jgi:mono/diheme cytochrome c family protein